MNRRLETKRMTLVRRDGRLNALGHHRPGSSAIITLCGCRSHSPCLSEACPVCMRRFRKSLVRSARQLGLPGFPWVRINIVLQGMDFPAGELHRFDIVLALQMLQRRIQRSPLSSHMVIGGIDVSWNTLNNNEGYWQGHVYVLVSGTKTTELVRAIRRVFPPSPTTFRPNSIVQVKPTSADFLGCLTYSYKAEFNWRSSYHEKRLRLDGSPRLNGRTRMLRGVQLAELSDWLSRYSVGDRLLLTGIRRLRAPQGTIRLALVTP